MFENIASIDIGTSCIKVAAVKTGFRDFQVRALVCEEIDTISADRDEAIKNTLARIVNDNDLQAYTFITSFPMEKTLIRNISFPFNEPDKIAAALPAQAEENIPFKLDDVILDFQNLRRERHDEGKVILAAVTKNSLHSFLENLNEADIRPVNMGMESVSLFNSYRYFNTIEENAVIQLDIGNSKTIVNIIKQGHLSYTRSIPKGVSSITNFIAEVTGETIQESNRLFRQLNIDLTSFENNDQRGYYKNLGLTKAKFRKIYNHCNEIFQEILDQVIITVKASFTETEDEDFSRIIISGGGSEISGVGSLFSKELSAPVVSHPFIDDTKDFGFVSQMTVAFGTLLAYIGDRRNNINFLKNEFVADVSSSSKRIYYLAAAFITLTLFVLIFNIIFSSILTSKSNEQYEKILQDRFKTYFRAKADNRDIIQEATAILKKEKKEFDSLSVIITENHSVLDLLKDITEAFPDDKSFSLKNIVINKSIVRLDASIGSSSSIDEFKNRLEKTGKFDSVSRNIKTSSRSTVNFSLTIKTRINDKKAKPGRRK